MAVDVKNDATLSTGLVSYWELEEASGTRVDSHGSHDLTDNNTVGQAVGKQGDAADFEFTNSEYLSNTSPSGLDGITDISISLWANLESFSATYPVFAAMWNEPGNQRAWALGIVSNQPYFYVSDDGSNFVNVTSGASLSTATWYHLVGTFDGNTGRIDLYVNGTNYNATNAGITGVYNSTAHLNIGRAQQFAGQTGYFDGIIDEVGIWNKTLTSGEVADLYNAGAGIPYDAGGGGAPRRVFIIS